MHAQTLLRKQRPQNHTPVIDNVPGLLNEVLVAVQNLDKADEQLVGVVTVDNETEDTQHLPLVADDGVLHGLIILFVRGSPGVDEDGEVEEKWRKRKRRQVSMKPTRHTSSRLVRPPTRPATDLCTGLDQREGRVVPAFPQPVKDHDDFAHPHARALLQLAGQERGSGCQLLHGQ